MPYSFSPQERRLLLSMPGIGATVVGRLEAAGFASLRALREAGSAGVTERVLAVVGQAAWLNRRRAIERAIRVSNEHTDLDVDPQTTPTRELK